MVSIGVWSQIELTPIWLLDVGVDFNVNSGCENTVIAPTAEALEQFAGVVTTW